MKILKTALFSVLVFTAIAHPGDPKFSLVVCENIISKIGSLYSQSKYASSTFVNPRSTQLSGMATGILRLKDCLIRGIGNGEDMAVIFLYDTNSYAYQWAKHIPSSSQVISIDWESQPRKCMSSDYRSYNIKIGVISGDSAFAKILVEFLDNQDFKKTLDSLKNRFPLEKGYPPRLRESLAPSPTK